MDTHLRQQAVNDLLDYCRDRQRMMNKGRMLAPVLLGRMWNNDTDDERLTNALEELLAAELAQLRQQMGVGVRAAGSAPTAEEQLKADIAARNKRLEALSYVWAHYIDGLATERLEAFANIGRRMVQKKIEAGRAEVAGVLGRQPAALASSRDNGQYDVPSMPATPASSHPQPAEADDRRAPTTQRREQRSTQTISGGNVQAVQGPVGGSVHQEQHIYHYTTPAQPSAQHGDTLLRVVALLLFVLAFWLIQRAPWLGVGLLLGICAWRAGWRTLRVWQQWRTTEVEDRWWQAGYAAAWLGTLGWSAVLMAQVAAAQAAPVFGIERLMLAGLFLGACLTVFWLATVDALLWIGRRPVLGWPLRLLTPRAAWCWRQRWMLLGLTWLMLGVFSASALAFLLTAQ